MAKAIQTPINVVFSTLKDMRVSNKSLAAIVLRSDRAIGGKTPRERFSEPTALNRLVNATEPGKYPATYYGDFAASAQTVCSRLISRGWTSQAVIKALAGSPSVLMRQALDAYSRDGALYLSVFQRACGMLGLSDADRASLALLVFIATGFIGEPAQAADLAEQFASTVAADGFKTELPKTAELKQAGHAGKSDARARLGAVRVVNGVLNLAEVHELSQAPEGTVIGTMVTDAVDAFNIPDRLVSRHHLRVYRSPDGTWRALGMKSTNGTTLISGADKGVVVIEPPRRGRPVGYEPKPVEVKAGDSLVLAGVVVFLLLPMQ